MKKFVYKLYLGTVLFLLTCLNTVLDALAWLFAAMVIKGLMLLVVVIEHVEQSASTLYMSLLMKWTKLNNKEETHVRDNEQYAATPGPTPPDDQATSGAAETAVKARV